MDAVVSCYKREGRGDLSSAPAMGTQCTLHLLPILFLSAAKGRTGYPLGLPLLLPTVVGLFSGSRLYLYYVSSWEQEVCSFAHERSFISCFSSSCLQAIPSGCFSAAPGPAGLKLAAAGGT